MDCVRLRMPTMSNFRSSAPFKTATRSTSLRAIWAPLRLGRHHLYVSRQLLPGVLPVLVRNIVCTVILIGFLALVRSGLNAALDAYGFWPDMAICIGGTALMVCAAFAWDWHEARQRR
jgi:hypothetical protein